RRTSLISEFARLQGNLVFLTGGEVTKDLDDLIYVLDTCQSRKLKSGFATNGSYITDLTIAERILSCDVDHIILSIDSHDKSLHDWVRGKGSYDSVTNAMRLLLNAKSKLGVNTKLIFQQVLFRRN